MKNISEFMRECNLFFTDTIDAYDAIDNSINTKYLPVKYGDAIKLKSFVASFNNMYSLFMKEYSSLPDLNLGKDLTFVSYDKFKMGENEYRVLKLYVEDPTISKEDSIFVYLREINGEVNPFICNLELISSPKYKRSDIKLDASAVKEYLDLFERYNLLIEQYDHLRNAQIFGNGIWCAFTQINDGRLDLLSGLEDFKLSIGTIDDAFFATIIFKLGENLSIDYKNSEFILNNKAEKFDKNISRQILNQVYINPRYVRKRQ